MFGDGFGQTRAYDASYRLTGILDTDLTTALRDISFGYEARNNLTSANDSLIPSNSEVFGYTPREELASASGAYGALAFGYDTVGNRLTQSSGSFSDIYAYPLGSNRLSDITLGSGGSRVFGHDASGNVLSETLGTTTREFEYDAAGRLAVFKSGGLVQATYLYDAMGRQAVRSLTSGPVALHSVFDSEGRRIAEYNEATGALIREYVWNGWEPVAVVEGGNVALVRTDHIGRPVFATDLTGTVVWAASYLPFGGVHVLTGTPIDARFPGQWFQTEAGLHQNWMRDYDPTLGRYLQPDPLGLVDGASLYGYARQNPGRWVDPTGECIGPLAIACAAAAGAAINVAIGALTDVYLGDGCYTWQEAGRDAAVGAAFGGLGRAWGVAGTAAQYGDDFASAIAKSGSAAEGRPIWTLGEGKSASKWAGQMGRRGWTSKQIDEALSLGIKFPAPNRVSPANGATRYIHPRTGRSVVVDNKTGQIIHVGGDGFKY